VKILLDIDDTVFVRGVRGLVGLHPRFFAFQKWARETNTKVTVWSSHEDGCAISELMGFDFVSKDDLSIPEADVLIDDQSSVFLRFCDVDKKYDSLDEFIETNL